MEKTLYTFSFPYFNQIPKVEPGMVVSLDGKGYVFTGAGTTVSRNVTVEPSRIHDDVRVCAWNENFILVGAQDHLEAFEISYDDILISNKAITLGDVSGKTCLLIDDMIDTAGTITQGAKALVEVGGAKEVYVCCTHAVLSGPAIERLENSVIKKVYMLNTIELPAEKKIAKIEEITVAPLFARAIESIFAELPLSRLYEN